MNPLTVNILYDIGLRLHMTVLSGIWQRVSVHHHQSYISVRYIATQIMI